MIGAMVVACLSAFLTAFSPRIEVFIALRWMIAASIVAVWTTGYVYCIVINIVGLGDPKLYNFYVRRP